MNAVHWFYSLPSSPPAATLERAHEKASERRFTGEPPTGFGPLQPSDSLVERIEQIWALAPLTSQDRDELQRDRDERNGDGPGQCVGGPR